MVKPTKWDDVTLKKTEEKEIETIYNGDESHGKSTIIIVCPFCKRETEAYIWSINGSGKRCNNNNCKAMLSTRIAFKLKELTNDTITETK